MRNLKTFLFTTLLLFVLTVSKAQHVKVFDIGWNGAHFFQPLSNLEIPLYQFNQNNPGMAKSYSLPDIFQGLYLDYRYGSSKAGVIISWSNKHGIAKAEGVASGNGETEYSLRRIKTRLNMFSYGFYFSLHKRIKMGITIDMGTFKVLKKIAPKAEYSTAKWEKYYDTKGTGAYGITANISFPIPLSEGFQIRFQPYAQLLFLPKKFTFTSGTISNKYYYNPSNFGITAFFSFISH